MLEITERSRKGSFLSSESILDIQWALTNKKIIKSFYVFKLKISIDGVNTIDDSEEQFEHFVGI